MSRTPEQQAADFIAANDISPVVAAGIVHNGGVEGPDNVIGLAITLADRSRHRLSSEASKLLPEGYPRWRLD